MFRPRQALNTSVNFLGQSKFRSVCCLFIEVNPPSLYLTHFPAQWRNLYFSISLELGMQLQLFQKGVIFPIYPSFVLPAPITTHLAAAKHSHAK